MVFVTAVYFGYFAEALPCIAQIIIRIWWASAWADMCSKWF